MSVSAIHFRSSRIFYAFTRQLLQKGILPLLILATLIFWSCATGLTQSSSAPASNTTPTSDVTDVVVFVNPSSRHSAEPQSAELPDASTVSIGVGYARKVDHKRVRQEIERLTALFPGAQLAEVQITDDRLPFSEESRNGSRDQTTTAAYLTLSNAPQVLNNAPQVRPYIQAFQRWNKIEVVFAMPPLQLYQGIRQMETRPLTVICSEGVNNYHYEITIRNHQGNLPPLQDTSPRMANTRATNGNGDAVSTSGRRELPSNALPLVVAGGLLVLVGATLFVVLQRRTKHTNQTPSLRL